MQCWRVCWMTVLVCARSLSRCIQCMCRSISWTAASSLARQMKTANNRCLTRSARHAINHNRMIIHHAYCWLLGKEDLRHIEQRYCLAISVVHCLGAALTCWSTKSQRMSCNALQRPIIPSLSVLLSVRDSVHSACSVPHNCSEMSLTLNGLPTLYNTLPLTVWQYDVSSW